MIRTWSCTIAGAPRPKKTSNRLVRAGRRMRVIPSRLHDRWFASSVPQVRIAFAGMAPFTGPVNVRATFWRHEARADLLNLMQALADLLERSGVIENDRLIHGWDGTCMGVDRDNARILVEVTEISSQSVAERISAMVRGGT